MRWLHSKAMLADCLTKVMDSTTLRHYLQAGRYALVDEAENLESRAGQRQSLAWLKKSHVNPAGTSELVAEK